MFHMHSKHFFFWRVTRFFFFFFFLKSWKLEHLLLGQPVLPTSTAAQVQKILFRLWCVSVSMHESVFLKHSTGQQSWSGIWPWVPDGYSCGIAVKRVTVRRIFLAFDTEGSAHHFILRKIYCLGVSANKTESWRVLLPTCCHRLAKGSAL